MKKIKTLSVGLSVLFLLSCENKQDANKPEKPKVETEKHQRTIPKNLMKTTCKNRLFL